MRNLDNSKIGFTFAPYSTENSMQTTGITIERNSRGEPAFARIDLKKHGDKLKDFFAANRIKFEDTPYDPEFVAKIRRAEKQESKAINLQKYGISI
jgi:hypothetical protein